VVEKRGGAYLEKWGAMVFWGKCAMEERRA